MKTLADAWNWYAATKANLFRMRRVAEKHWNDLSSAYPPIRQDEPFKTLDADGIVADSETSLGPIDDLAVVVLFSVFESHVRDYLVELLKPEAHGILDPILKEAAADAMRGVEEGSFYRRVLEPLKKQKRVSADLITQVDQVREYRNWVAHGRRDAPSNNATPAQAYERLSEFLGALGIAAEAEEDGPNRAEHGSA